LRVASSSKGSGPLAAHGTPGVYLEGVKVCKLSGLS
jgi:hypothetical protein